MSDELATLKQQITLLSAALHAIAAAMPEPQANAAADLFSEIAQFPQAKLEASQIDDETLAAFVELRHSLESAFRRPRQE